MDVQCSRPKVVLVPYPAQGHVSPMVQLASALHSLGFQPIVINAQFMHDRLFNNGVARDDHDSGVMFLSVPDGIHGDRPCDFVSILFAMENVMPPHLEKILESFGHGEEGIVCVITDLLASWAIRVAEQRRVPVAGFWPAMHATYSIVKSIPDLIQQSLISSDDGAPLVEGTVSFLPSDLPKLRPEHLPWYSPDPGVRLVRFKFWLEVLHRSSVVKWVLINSFVAENRALGMEAGQDIDPISSPLDPLVFPVGPLTRKVDHNLSMWEEDGSCISWLAKQARGSVMYVSFGSWVKLSPQHHVVELAMALEATTWPFLWSLRAPWQAMLPTGFIERVGSRGKVVEWAPQREVLSSDAVGCFLTHCGWNSTLEAIIAGQPLLCWPVSGDEGINCEFIVKVWRVGTKLEGKGRDEIKEGMLKMISQKEELKRNMEAMRERVLGIEGELMAEESLKSFRDIIMKKHRTKPDNVKAESLPRSGPLMCPPLEGKS
ncbi:UDP-glycosyltransferase [Nymphaea thermarum]|nr:UDP-glycosyltransferase [Nymphaea thermarum]